MSRPASEPGSAHYSIAPPRRIKPGLISVVTLLSRSGATGSPLTLNGGHTQTRHSLYY